MTEQGHGTGPLPSPQVGPRIITLAEQRSLLDEVQRLREWVAATVMMVELNALDAEGIEGIRRTGKELLNG